MRGILQEKLTDWNKRGLTAIMADMNKVNYQKVLDQTLAQLQEEGRVPRLLIHSCCAPCSSYVLEYLSRYFDITDYFYNPNIYPAEEHEHRIRELNHFIEQMPSEHPISFLAGDYEDGKYYEAVRGLEHEPERGKRCEVCFRLRLEEAARKAGELKMDYFTTTLSISPMKDEQLLNEIGAEMGEKYGVSYLYSDFKKKGGYLRSTQLSREYGLYRQDYCGCVFSMREREELRAQKQTSEESLPEESRLSRV